jgi:hypothetical protein
MRIISCWKGPWEGDGGIMFGSCQSLITKTKITGFLNISVGIKGDGSLAEKMPF